MITTLAEKTCDIDIDGYPTQVDFIESTDFLTAFIAGYGAGKSHAGAVKSLLFCLQNPGAWGLITAPQVRVLEMATLETYEKVFPPELIKMQRRKPHPEWHLNNGCRLFFWSTDKPETIVAGEVAFAHMDEASLSPLMAYSRIRPRLRQRNEQGKEYPYQLWITTTPKQLNWLYHEILNRKVRLFTASTLENKYLGDEDARRRYVEDRIGAVKGTKEYEQNVEGKFVILTGDSLFKSDTLDRILSDCLAPLEVRDNGSTSIWKYPVVGGRYVAGIDCADEGGGGVNDCIIIDAQTGEEMAEMNCNIEADKFAYQAFCLMREYYNPLCAPERNGTAGGIVVTKLADLGYSNLYKDKKGKPGWYTSSTGIGENISRYTMLLEYEEAVRLRRTIVHSSDAVGEFSTFIREEGDIYRPRPGCRSDRVMARAIAWQMRKSKPHGKHQNLYLKRLATSYA